MDQCAPNGLFAQLNKESCLLRSIIMGATSTAFKSMLLNDTPGLGIKAKKFNFGSWKVKTLEFIIVLSVDLKAKVRNL